MKPVAASVTVATATSAVCPARRGTRLAASAPARTTSTNIAIKPPPQVAAPNRCQRGPPPAHDMLTASPNDRRDPAGPISTSPTVHHRPAWTESANAEADTSASATTTQRYLNAGAV